MRRSLIGLAVLLGIGAMSWLHGTDANAQVVARSPEGDIQVRVPFVQVDVFRGGGVSVRAPYAAVDVPRSGRRAPRGATALAPGAAGSFPPPTELAQMDDDRLRLALRLNAERLYEQLGQFDTGDTWRRFLLRAAEDALNELNSDPEAREAIAALLDRFEVVIDEQQYAMIAELPAFQAMLAALNKAAGRRDQQLPSTAGSDEELPLPEPETPRVPQLQLPPPQR